MFLQCAGEAAAQGFEESLKCCPAGITIMVIATVMIVGRLLTLDQHTARRSATAFFAILML
jgi:hypothetical protein